MVSIESGRGRTYQVSLNPTNVEDDPFIFRVHKMFRLLEQALELDEDNLIESVKGVYSFKVKNAKGQEGMWIIDLRHGKARITYNGKEKPDVTLMMNDEDVYNLVTGKISPQRAFFQGKVKIRGNMGLAIKLTELQRRTFGRVTELMAKL